MNSNMTRKRLLMIGGWTDLFEKSKACGFDLTVIQRKSDLKTRDFEVADHLATLPMNSPEVVEVACAMHREQPFDAVISFQEYGVLNAARIGDRLQLFSNPLAAVELARDKGLMRQRLVDAGIPSIPFALASSAQEVLDFASKVGWPVIVKPVNASGSDCVRKLTAASEVAEAVDRILRTHPHAHVLVEQYMVGPEVSVEGISWDGQHRILGTTDKITTGAPNFVELGHTHPSSLPADTLAQIEAMTLRVLEAVGHRHGPSHTEIIVTADGPRLVETHTRTGGDRIFEIVELVHGVDLFTSTLQGFAGDFPALPEQPASAAAIRFFHLPPGRVSVLEGIEEARQMPGVVRVDHSLAVGKEVGPLRHSGDRMGYILVQAPTREQAVARVEAAMAQVRIEVEPPQAPAASTATAALAA
ncbi:ATP-grasp domain-containing protein [Roseateles flavus]|uniref:ATP-grasp domain-containing protein n=1 Tax=Roseateles flavus TaxID=3149041 RepID=A0ABV0GJ05_9BURK